MKTYRGQRTEYGCEVTVDGRPLRMRSDLSGNATSPFDWGYVGTGQLSMALLADFLGDARAKALCHGFDQQVVAALPRNAWTRTDDDFATAVEPLARAYDAGVHIGSDHASADHLIADDASDGVEGAAAAFGDMPSQTDGSAAEKLAAEAAD